MNKFISFCLIASLSIICQATNIEWNRITAVDAEVWDSGPLWMVGGYSEQNFSINPIIVVTTDFLSIPTDPYAGKFMIASPLMSGGSTIWAKQMSYGSIVSYVSMAPSPDGYFYQTEQFVEEMHSDYNIPIDPQESIYLAFSTIAYDDQTTPYPVYGWVEISASGDAPTVLSSAWDIDGGAMIVGGGAVPEPTSGLLLLIGMAGLALRRKSTSTQPHTGGARHPPQDIVKPARLYCSQLYRYIARSPEKE